MKLNHVTNSKSKCQNPVFSKKKNSVLFNLQTLKARVIKRVFKHGLLLSKVEKEFMQLKTTLSVIYYYHFFEKTILFIGIPSKIVAILSKNKDSHLFLPSKFWLKGIFSNRNFLRKYLRYQRLKNTQKVNRIDDFRVLKKFPKLIVTFGSSIDQTVLDEICRLKIPIVSFNNSKTNKKSLYTIFTKTKSNLTNLFLNLLVSLFTQKKNRSLK